jgi:uncharacterized membrane protein
MKQQKINNAHKCWQTILDSFKKFFAKPELVFATMAGVFGFISVFVMPMQMVPDEQSHFSRAYTLSEGKIFPDEEVDGISAYNLPRQIVEYNHNIKEVAFTRHTDDDIFSDQFDPTVFTQKVDLDDKKLDRIWGTESYAPIAHLPQAIGIVFGRLIYPSIGVMYMFGRLFNLIFYVAAVYFIIKRTKRARWAYVIIALSPMIISHAASFSADSIAMIGILGMFMVIHNLFIQKDKIKLNQLIWLVIFAATAAFVRPTNLVLLFPLVALPASLFAANRGRFKRLPFNLRKWVSITGAVAVVGLLAWGWMQFYNTTYNTVHQSGASSSSKISWMIDHPVGYMKKVTNLYVDADVEHGSFSLERYLYNSIGGQFSWRCYSLPISVFTLQYIILLLAVLVSDKQKAKGSEAAISLLTYLAIIFATPTAMFIMSNATPETTEFGLQARYFTPMFVVLIPIGLWLQKWISVKLKSEMVIGVLVSCVTFIALTCYVIETLMTFV